MIKTYANQWKNAPSLIEWSVNINEKERLSFMTFDIESFYPSTTERLFTNAVQFAKQMTKIPYHNLSSINQSRKTLFFNKKIPWVKKDGSEECDVPVAEVYEIVGTFSLNKLKIFFKETHLVYIETTGWKLLKDYLVWKLRDWKIS